MFFLHHKNLTLVGTLCDSDLFCNHQIAPVLNKFMLPSSTLNRFRNETHLDVRNLTILLI